MDWTLTGLAKVLEQFCSNIFISSVNTVINSHTSRRDSLVTAPHTSRDSSKVTVLRISRDSSKVTVPHI